MSKLDLWSAAAVGVVCLVFFADSAPARAQGVPGVTENEVVIGSCSALEGPSRALGTETTTGAKAYFSSVNDEGGVHGRAAS